MKKLALLSAILVLMLSGTVVSAQPALAVNKKNVKKENVESNQSARPPLKKLEGNSPSQDSQTTFYMTIGNVPDIQWKRGDFYDEARYVKDGVNSTAYFDINGALVGILSQKSANDLPQSVEKNIKKKYEGSTIDQVLFFQDNEENSTDMTLFGVQFESQTAIFVTISNSTGKSVLMCNKQGEVNLFKQL